ncbi:hypothetical protein [uncultured Oscillibacter sp.]|uniref:hypothetical protein n=1 Tax=uncultured Oscillibacter sp. TaxID=876091 RepID=UPI0025CEFC6E|nr:hypothetical protein [uncultured Oscillibacter sp.]
MKMRKQRHMGAALVVLSWLILLLAATRANPIDQDATAVVLLLPLGLYLIFTKHYILCP